MIRSKALNPQNVSSIYQPYPLGLGYAVLSAKNFIGKEVFAVILPEELLLDRSSLRKMTEKYEESPVNIISSTIIEPINCDK